VRIGWGDEKAQYRLTVDHRADRGLQGSGGDDFVNRVNLSSAFQISAQDRLEMRAGQSVISAGIGFKEYDDYGIHNRWIDTSYLQLDWLHILSANEDVAVQYSRTQETVQDLFPNTTYSGVVMDHGGTITNDNLLLKHSYRFDPALRWTWGGELRRESTHSLSVFNTDTPLRTDFQRLFANAEWHVLPDVVLNAGDMWERASDSGETNSPRAMLNWHLLPRHTLRYGSSRAYRPPSVFENFAHQAYQAPSLAADYPGGKFVDYQSIGGLQPESIVSRELGYLGSFEPLKLQVDARIFEETVTDTIKERKLANGYTKYYVNIPGVNINGMEHPLHLHGVDLQMQLQPWEGGKVFMGGEWLVNEQNYPQKGFSSGFLMFSQQFHPGIEFSLMYSQYDALPEFPYDGTPAPAVSRTDIRIAKSLHWGKTPGELSLVVQNLGPSYSDYFPTFRFNQQAYVMLKIGL
jgi:iron complex outermembrane receptor protein